MKKALIIFTLIAHCLTALAQDSLFTEVTNDHRGNLRFGLSAEQIVGMGRDTWQKHFFERMGGGPKSTLAWFTVEAEGLKVYANCLGELTDMQAIAQGYDTLRRLRGLRNALRNVGNLASDAYYCGPESPLPPDAGNRWVRAEEIIKQLGDVRGVFSAKTQAQDPLITRLKKVAESLSRPTAKLKAKWKAGGLRADVATTIGPKLRSALPSIESALATLSPKPKEEIRRYISDELHILLALGEGRTEDL